MTPAEIEHRREVYENLVRRVIKSVTGASSTRKAGEYVANALTVHDLDLLAECAVTFAREHVERRLSEPSADPMSTADRGDTT